MSKNSITFQILGLEEAIAEAVAKVLEQFRSEAQPTAPQSHSVDSPSEFYTREELCHMAHISPCTLWRMEKDGLIRKLKFGKKNLYPKREVDALLESGKLSKLSQ